MRSLCNILAQDLMWTGVLGLTTLSYTELSPAKQYVTTPGLVILNPVCHLLSAHPPALA